MTQEQWLALNLGNSRLHGAIFMGQTLQQAWDYPHSGLSLLEAQVSRWEYQQILIASVVPTIVTPWHTHPRSRCLTHQDVAIAGMYPTLGIDRALSVWGAGTKYGFPVLVIDGGTALTLTGVDRALRCVGGAIFPGLQLLCQGLSERIPTLPGTPLPATLPSRWAQSTIGGLESGLIYIILAGIESYILDWKRQFPQSAVVFTGGDGDYLHHFFPQFLVDPHLVFWGMVNAYSARHS